MITVQNNEFFERMLEQSTLIISGNINKKMVLKIYDSITYFRSHNSPEIEIEFHGDGGDIESGLHIYDLIRSYTGETTGIVKTFANSMASVILQACDIRNAEEHARILIHRPYFKKIGYNDLFLANDQKKIKKTIKDDYDAMLKIYSSRSNRSIKEIDSLCRQEKIFSSSEALKFGLIDKIIK